MKLKSSKCLMLTALNIILFDLGGNAFEKVRPLM